MDDKTLMDKLKEEYSLSKGLGESWFSHEVSEHMYWGSDFEPFYDEFVLWCMEKMKNKYSEISDIKAGDRVRYSPKREWTTIDVVRINENALIFKYAYKPEDPEWSTNKAHFSTSNDIEKL